ncbi:probable E3 ubiquitin-protein ligase RHG1A [Macadamia integrifolia]|uniref:probable E3 ubiquitin-protein ligase RHG1A n=1 Tax=Macadamia integrifolia TaxID=60698 RepID=UPI001C50157C|nr:probable E3 ubiquitin-protein ligase RHG1A [Macadamia integrifolia]
MHRPSQLPPGENPPNQSIIGRRRGNNSGRSLQGGDTCESDDSDIEGVSDQSLDGNPSLFQLDNDLGLLSLLGSKRVHNMCKSDHSCSSSYERSLPFDPLDGQTSERSSSSSHPEDLSSVHISDLEQILPHARSSPEYISMGASSSTAVVISRRDPRPLSETITGRGISEIPQPPLSNIIEIIESIFSGSQVASSSVSRQRSNFSWVIHSRLLLPRISHGVPDVIQRSVLPSIGFSSRSGNSLSPQLTQFPSLPFDGVGSESEVDTLSQQYLQSVLFMQRLDSSVIARSILLRMLTAGSGGQVRLVSEDILILSQSPSSDIADLHDYYGDMQLDVDNMSYEELLALEDHIGNVSTGLSEEVIIEYLKLQKYFLFSEEKSLKESCSICQEEYVEEDELGVLDCEHDFHSACIKQWLRCKNLCPICKATGLTTLNPTMPINT